MSQNNETLVVPPVDGIHPIGTRTLGLPSGQTVEVDVYDPEDFPPAVRALIPAEDDYYVDHLCLAARIVKSHQQDRCTMLSGAPGTGKSAAFRHLASVMQVPYWAETISGGVGEEVIIGQRGLAVEDGAPVTVNEPSRIGSMIRYPSVVVLEEWNGAEAGVQQVARPLVNPGEGFIAAAGTRTERHPANIIGATGNPAWDPANTGVLPLADADRRRFRGYAVGHADRGTSWAIVATMIQREGWDVTTAKAATAVIAMEEIRAMTENGDAAFNTGLADLLSFVAALSYEAPSDAIRCVYHDTDPADLAVLDVLFEDFAWHMVPPAMESLVSKQAAGAATSGSVHATATIGNEDQQALVNLTAALTPPSNIDDAEADDGLPF